MSSVKGSNPFDTHPDVKGEVVLEGKTNVPTQFIPSSFPDLAAMTSPSTPPSLPPPMTMPPTSMNPAMQTRPFGASPPGSFNAPPPSMPFTDRPGSFKTMGPDGFNVFNSFDNVRPGTFPGGPPGTMPPGSFNGMPPGSFRGGPPPGSFRGGPPGSGFPPMQTNLQSKPGGMVHQMSWAGQRDGPMATNATGFWDVLPGAGQPKRDPASRLGRAERTNAVLEDNLNAVTSNYWKETFRANFSALGKANMDDVDWRVPRVNYCKEPKYNDELPANMRRTISQAKAKDGEILEHVLGQEAIRQWAEANPNTPMPPEELVLKPGTPFIAVHPGYRRWDDMWERELTLRNLGEAMRGDLNVPMAKPVLFGEDYQNFHSGKYLKDECPIA